MKRTLSFPSSAPSSRANKSIVRSVLLSLFFTLSITITACSGSSVPVDPKVELANDVPAPEAPVQPNPTTTSNQIMFGAYTYGGVWSGLEPVLDLESDLGRRLDIVHWFMGWHNEWESELVASAAQNGRLPMLSWEPTTTTIQEIAAGAQDDYIQRFAQGAKDYANTVYIRPFPEMNGEWAPWNGDTANFVIAWQRMADIFTEVGADNVMWVWAPNITDQPRTEANQMELYYPGDAYVDILALDGYNWGNTKSWSEWTSFEDTFSAPYERVAQIGNQPIWLAEVASAEQGGDKSKWISDMFASTSFPRLEALVWFNEDKEANWHIDSSSAALAAFQTSLANNVQVAGLQ